MNLLKALVSKVFRSQIPHTQTDEQNELKIRLFIKGLDLRTANRVAQFMTGVAISLTPAERAQAIALLGGSI